MAKVLILVGALLLAVGLIWHTFPGAFSWFGRLPGDIRIEGDNTRFYFPITSMILISIVISLALNLWRRF